MTIALVLGAAVSPDGSASPTLRLRVAHAVSLYEAGAVEAICIAGGQGRYGAPEGEVGARLAREMGVPETALIAETASRNTVENLALAAPLMRGHGVVIVSNRWHLPRARLAAALLGLRAAASGPRGTMSRKRMLMAILREAAAMPSTAMRAWRWRGFDA